MYATTRTTTTVMKASTLFFRAIGTMGEQIMDNMLEEKVREQVLF